MSEVEVSVVGSTPLGPASVSSLAGRASFLASVRTALMTSATKSLTSDPISLAKEFRRRSSMRLASRSCPSPNRWARTVLSRSRGAARRSWRDAGPDGNSSSGGSASAGVGESRSGSVDVNEGVDVDLVTGVAVRTGEGGSCDSTVAAFPLSSRSTTTNSFGSVFSFAPRSDSKSSSFVVSASDDSSTKDGVTDGRGVEQVKSMGEGPELSWSSRTVKEVGWISPMKVS